MMNKEEKRLSKKAYLDRNRIDVYLGDTLVGSIREPSYDMFWTYGTFKAGPGFELIKDKVERYAALENLREQEDISEEEDDRFFDEQTTILSELDEMKLSLNDSSSTSKVWLGDFKVVDGVCEFKENE